MGKGNKKRERENRKSHTRTVAESKVIERDELVPSPEERAGYIYAYLKKHLPDLNNWDLICFCTEYLGSQVLANEDLIDKDAVVLLARSVNFAHYTFDEEPQSGITRNAAE